MSQEDKNDLSEKELLWQIYKNTEKTRKYILGLQILSVLKLLLIVVPIVLAIIYLPPFFVDAIEQYKNIIGTATELQQMVMPSVPMK